MKINRTAKRTIQVLDYISLQNQGATVAEIATHFDIPKTSIYDIVMALVHEEVLQVAWNEGKRYQVGIRAFEIGNRFRADLYTIAQNALQALSNELGRTTFLAAEDQGSIVYLGKYGPENPIVSTTALGSRKPMYCTALGKAILATYPDEEVANRIAANPIKVQTEYTVKNIAELTENLHSVRRQGYAFDDREQEVFLQCLAAPVFNHAGHVLGAVSISFVCKGDEDIPELGRIIWDTSLGISQKMGYSGTGLGEGTA
ncbi:IclR family transcriptional regulator [Candidatus Haliotispira prima]|uniref:IclR family transcriptional regulator n=1 Tax=Candidatus Haliotispira prima TaxID=3034016 RepID=A0ABY8MGY0_9SPIO|nr:IclR family transcriptional regulator [Candidatus Haliotispira prima]